MNANGAYPRRNIHEDRSFSQIERHHLFVTVFAVHVKSAWNGTDEAKTKARVHRVGYEIACEHPRRFVRTRTKAACDVRQRHVRDGSIEHVHERGKRHRKGDDPGLTRGCQPMPSLVAVAELKTVPSVGIHQRFAMLNVKPSYYANDKTRFAARFLSLGAKNPN